MSSSDLYVDGFPHGTPQGYDDGCRGGACPAGVAYGLSCKTAKAKSRGDFQYRKLVKAGAGIPAIAEALGLIGTETLPAPAKKPTAKKVAPTPTPATAKGGVSLADAASAPTTTAAAAKGDVADAPAAAPAPETFLPLEHTEQAQKMWDAAAEELQPAAEPAPAPTPSEIRAWAREKGYEVGAKGKLKQHIVDHYWEATGRLSNATAEADVDTEQLEQDTAAPAEDTIVPQVDPEPAPEISQTFVEISIDVPDALLPPQRPEWGDVAESVDVEAARSLAVRLEQELARTTELLEQERDAGTDLARDYLNELGKTIAQEEHITDLRKRLERETNLRKIAERAATLALTKWGQERADSEAAHALIIGQAHTINQLTAALEGPRWFLGEDIDTGSLPISPGRLMQVPETSYYYSSLVDGPDGTIAPDGTWRPRPNTIDDTPSLDPLAVAAVNAELQRGEEVVKGRPWWRR